MCVGAPFERVTVHALFLMGCGVCVYVNEQGCAKQMHVFMSAHRRLCESQRDLMLILSDLHIITHIHAHTHSSQMSRE